MSVPYQHLISTLIVPYSQLISTLSALGLNNNLGTNAAVSSTSTRTEALIQPQTMPCWTHCFALLAACPGFRKGGSGGWAGSKYSKPLSSKGKVWGWMSASVRALVLDAASFFGVAHTMFFGSGAHAILFGAPWGPKQNGAHKGCSARPTQPSQPGSAQPAQPRLAWPAQPAWTANSPWDWDQNPININPRPLLCKVS